MGNDKLTKMEKYWILYDVGNSAFTLLVSTIIPIYFNALAGNAGISEVDYLAYWGYAASISTVIVAILGPTMGTVADTRNYKKPLFVFFMMIGVIGCAALSVPASWIVFLVVFVIAKVGYNASLIFYDSMLVDVTTPERMDKVSSHGYAWGYIGSCIPFIISLVFVLMYESIGITMNTAMMLAFLINAAWWVLMTLPLLKNYRQKNFAAPPEHPIKDSFIRLGHTLRDIKKEKKIFLYLLYTAFLNIFLHIRMTLAVQDKMAYKAHQIGILPAALSPLTHHFLGVLEKGHCGNIMEMISIFCHPVWPVWLVKEKQIRPLQSDPVLPVMSFHRLLQRLWQTLRHFLPKSVMCIKCRHIYNPLS